MPSQVTFNVFIRFSPFDGDEDGFAECPALFEIVLALVPACIDIPAVRQPDGVDSVPGAVDGIHKIEMGGGGVVNSA